MRGRACGVGAEDLSLQCDRKCDTVDAECRTAVIARTEMSVRIADFRAIVLHDGVFIYKVFLG